MDADYKQHWDEKFKAREWGRYPPEDLVRFMGRNYKQCDRSQVRVVEIGCGPGANLWFLHREGFNVAAIDGSPTAIEQASTRLTAENEGMNAIAPDLKVGDFSQLPWGDASMDVALDIFAVYANTTQVIERTIAEVARVLKPGGRFYAKLWGKNCTGYGEGECIEDGTYDAIPTGPCADMGVSHFFDEAEIHARYSPYFTVDAIDVVTRSDNSHSQIIEEYACQFTRRA